MYLRNSSKIEVIHTKNQTTINIYGGNYLPGMVNFLEDKFPGADNVSDWVQHSKIFEEYMAQAKQTITISHTLSSETFPEIVHVYPEDPRPLLSAVQDDSNLTNAA
jgi:hypothetical protein